MRSIKTYIIITAFFCLPFFVFAQQEFTVSGILYKKSTDDRLAQGTVTNLRTQTIMMSDELGGFTIKAAKGDTLLYNHTGFTPQKQVVNNPNDVIVYMQPIVVLPQVTIQGQTKKQELNEVMNEYHTQGTYFDGKPPAWSFINSPLTGLYELFGKTPNEARRFKEYSTQEIESSDVNKRYTKELVKRVTALPDTDVVKFMQQYKPSYEDIKQWDDYQLISHIKKYLEYYKTHKSEVPPQKLY